MSLINHNISSANDGLGDQLRTAFGNQNLMNSELYTETGQLRTDLIAAATGASGKSIVPTDTPSGTGIASWTATQAGTYTNFGGVVVNANSFAIISRDAGGVFSISQTALDLTSYAKTSYLDDVFTDNSTILTVPSYSGTYPNNVNPLTTYRGNLTGFFNFYSKPLISFNIISNGSGIADFSFVTINADNTFKVLHNQSFNVVLGENVFLNTDIRKSFFGVKEDIYILAKSTTAGVLLYANSASDTMIQIPLSAVNVIKSIGYVINIKINVSFGNILLTNILNIHENILLEKNGIYTAWDLSNELKTKKDIIIPDGEHVINSTVFIPSGVSIRGNSKNAILKAGSGVTRVLSLINVDNIYLSNFQIKGVGNLPNTNSTTEINSLPDVVFLTNKGNNEGIYLENTKNVELNSLTISRFDGTGLNTMLTSYAYTDGCKYRNLNIKECFLGARFQNSSEYSQLSTSSINDNLIGVFVSSGNFSISDTVITGNRVNVCLSEGSNSGHGTLNACLINHAKYKGIITYNVFTGYVINGCCIIDAPIEINTSQGINITNGIINSTILINGGSNTQRNAFIGNSFFKSVGGGTITITNNSVTSLKNNYYADGSDSIMLNN